MTTVPVTSPPSAGDRAGRLLSAQAAQLVFPGLAVVYSGWAAAVLLGLIPRNWINDLAYLPLYLIVGVGGLSAARAWAPEPRIARGWQLVGVAWLASAAGSSVWLLNWVWPSPIVDAIGWLLYNIYYPIVLVGLWHLFRLPPRGLGRVRLAVEGLIVTVATAALAWYFVFRFGEAAQSVPALIRAVTVLFLGEMLVVFGATAVLHSPAEPGDSRSVAMLTIGLFIATIADFVYEQNRMLGTVWSGPAGDLMLAWGAILIASAAWMSARGANRTTPAGVSRGLNVLPYLTIGVVGSLLVFEALARGMGGGPVGGLVLSGALLLGLVIVRLLVAQREFAEEATARWAQGAVFTSLVQRSSDGILIVDRDGAIRYSSPALDRIAGPGTLRPAGQRFPDLIHPTQRAAAAEWLRGLTDRTTERWRLGGAGSWREVEAVASDLTADPLVGGIVVNVRDITERVELETRLRQAEKLEVAGRLSSSVAHDFNNILTVILGNLQLVRPDGAGEMREAHQQIEAAAKRGAALARQLLALSRPTPSQPSVLDLGRVVGTMEKTLRNALPASIELTVGIAPESTPVGLDDVQVEQILLNLSLNARDAMPAGGDLEIVVDRPPVGDGVEGLPAGARLVVRDSGMGMSSETLAHAFEPFFTTKPSGFGTGLGLAAVRRIVTEAGGHVEIDSEPGRGTTVTVSLPLKMTASPVPASTTEPAGPAAPGTGRILIVDDEPAVRRVLAQYLGRLGYRVFEATNGITALDFLNARGWDIDLVLTDLVMPKMGGADLAGRIEAVSPRLPVLCMSGTPGAMDATRGPWSALRVISKPPDLEVLAARVAAEIGTRK